MKLRKFLHRLFPNPLLIFPRIDGVRPLKWNVMLVKRFFDTGYGITGYIKYPIFFFGIATLEVRSTMILAVLYAIVCVLVGYWWFVFRFAEADVEMSNMVNIFVREMRDTVVNSKKKDMI